MRAGFPEQSTALLSRNKSAEHAVVWAESSPSEEESTHRESSVPFCTEQNPALPSVKVSNVPSLHETACFTLPVKVMFSMTTPNGEMRDATLFPFSVFERNTSSEPSLSSAGGSLLSCASVSMRHRHIAFVP